MLLGVTCHLSLSLLPQILGRKAYFSKENLRHKKYNLRYYFTKVSDLVPKERNYRANRTQSNMLELLRCSR